LITQQLLAGYSNPGITTPVVGDYRTGFAVTDGFNTALTPYSFNLTRSRQLLQAAGYLPAAL
jgi:ABC-type transport system substrate-binding protein